MVRRWGVAPTWPAHHWRRACARTHAGRPSRPPPPPHPPALLAPQVSVYMSVTTAVKCPQTVSWAELSNGALTNLEPIAPVNGTVRCGVTMGAKGATAPTQPDTTGFNAYALFTTSGAVQRCAAVGCCSGVPQWRAALVPEASKGLPASQPAGTLAPATRRRSGWSEVPLQSAPPQPPPPGSLWGAAGWAPPSRPRQSGARTKLTPRPAPLACAGMTLETTQLPGTPPYDSTNNIW